MTTQSTDWLTRDYIFNRVGEPSFSRGERYYERGAIENLVQQGYKLKAQCRGSMPTPYHVWVQLGSEGIDSAECSCPVGDGGYCKHVAALLLTWLHTADSLPTLAPFDEILEHLEKPELVDLIERTLQRYPDIEDFVYATIDVITFTAAEDVKPDHLRKQVAQSIKRAGNGPSAYGMCIAIVNDLELLMEPAEEYRKNGDWRNAALIHQSILAEVSLRYGDIPDHNDDLHYVFRRSSLFLGECLDQIQDVETRFDILQTLTDVILLDIQRGGYGLPDTVNEVVIQHALPEEIDAITSWVDQRIRMMVSSDQTVTEWHMQGFGRFILSLCHDSLSDEDYIQLCRRAFLRSELVERLLSLGRVDEALEVAETVSGYDFLRMADRFVAHNYDTIAENMVKERAPDSKYGHLESWLKEQAVRKKDWSQAVQHAENEFWRHPSVTLYKEIRDLAENTGDWAELRQSIHTRLYENEDYGVLTEIHLLENNIEAAIACLPSTRFGFNRLTPQVAAAAEKTHPREAIRLYMQAAEQLIEMRGRDNYAAAIPYVQRVKSLFQDLDDLPGWVAVIQSLRNHKPRLPALLDELKRAGL